MPGKRAAIAPFFVVILTILLALSGCGTASTSDSYPPPPGDYDRPALVRGAARTGSYVGAAVGIVASIVLWLPVQGLNLIADEPLGYTEREWTFLPLTTCVAGGHHLFGLPAEGLYQIFYGLWVDRPEPVGFEHVPGSTQQVDDGRG